MRGFGITFENGRVRSWYIDKEGDRRWADTDELVERRTS